MDLNNQKQSAGDNSTQIIAQTIIYNNGVTEERAREIMIEIYKERSTQLLDMARATASERVEQLSDRVIPKMLEYDQKLEFLQEPSIQRVIFSAQNTAACTGSQQDYELLSDLLIERIKNRNNRKVSFTHEKAIEIVDKIPEEDLSILNVIYYITHLQIGDSKIDWWEFNLILLTLNHHIQVLLHNQEFPKDYSWIETLDALSLIKSFPNGVNGLVRFTNIITIIFHPLLCKGIEKDGIKYEEIKRELIELGLPWQAILMCHPFIKENVLVCWPRVSTDSIGSNEPPFKRMIFTESQRRYFDEIERTVNMTTPEDISVRKAFTEKLKSFPALKALSEWWDRIPLGLQLTAVGDLLASTSIKMTCKSLYDTRNALY